MKYCPECGSSLTGEESFCAECGNELDSSGSEPDSSSNEPDSSTPVEQEEDDIEKAPKEAIDEGDGIGRRKIILGGGAVAVGLGYLWVTNGMPGINTGPATHTITSAEVDADELELGEDYTLTMGIRNEGGETGTPSGSVQVESSGGQVAEEIELTTGEIGPGETVEVEHEFSPEYPGSYSIVPMGNVSVSDGLEFNVNIDVSTLGIGESGEFGGNYRITPNSVDLRDSVFYDIDVRAPATIGLGGVSGKDLRPSTDNRTLAVVRIEMENISTSTQGIGADSIEVMGGNLVTSFQSISDVAQGTHGRGLSGQGRITDADIDGTPLFNIEINPGNSEECWVLIDVAKDSVEDLMLKISDNDNVLIWDVGTQESAPEFELENLDVPSERNGTEEFTFTVRNSGSEGVFRGAIFYRDAASGDVWVPWTTITERIPADESRDITVTSNSDETFEYLLRPFDSEWVVE